MSGTPGERESRDDVPPFAFVVERPIDEKPSDRARCPYCGGNSLSNDRAYPMSTLARLDGRPHRSPTPA